MGRGIGMGNTCKPMAVSFQCMTKFTTNKKKIKKIKNKKCDCIEISSCLELIVALSVYDLSHKYFI